MYVPHVSRGIICVYVLTTGQLITRISMEGSPDGSAFHEPIGIAIVPSTVSTGSTPGVPVVPPSNDTVVSTSKDVTILVTDRSNRLFSILLRDGATATDDSLRRVRPYGKDATETTFDDGDDILEDEFNNNENSAMGGAGGTRASHIPKRSSMGASSALMASKRGAMAGTASKRASRMGPPPSGLASKRGSMGGGGLASNRTKRVSSAQPIAPSPTDLPEEELLDFPTQICIAPSPLADGKTITSPATIYICDSYRARVVTYTIGGWPPRLAGITSWISNEDELSERYGMALATNPLQLYVTDYGAHSIGVFDME
jgi:hypothetical protein